MLLLLLLRLLTPLLRTGFPNGCSEAWWVGLSHWCVTRCEAEEEEAEGEAWMGYWEARWVPRPVLMGLLDVVLAVLAASLLLVNRCCSSHNRVVKILCYLRLAVAAISTC